MFSSAVYICIKANTQNPKTIPPSFFDLNPTGGIYNVLAQKVTVLA